MGPPLQIRLYEVPAASKPSMMPLLLNTVRLNLQLIITNTTAVTDAVQTLLGEKL